MGICFDSSALTSYSIKGKNNSAGSGGHLEPLLSSKLGNFQPMTVETGETPSNKVRHLSKPFNIKWLTILEAEIGPLEFQHLVRGF